MENRTARGIAIATATAVASAVGVWLVLDFFPGALSDAHAAEHTTDKEQLQQVREIASENALYINTQILAQLYLRADRLRTAVSGGDVTAREPLASAEVEIRRREARLIQANGR